MRTHLAPLIIMKLAFHRVSTTITWRCAMLDNSEAQEKKDAIED